MEGNGKREAYRMRLIHGYEVACCQSFQTTKNRAMKLLEYSMPGKFEK